MKSITIKSIKLHPVALVFAEPLQTSFGEEPFKAALIVEVTTENGITGWGEVSAETRPGYCGETVGTAYHIVQNFMIPPLIGQQITDPREIPQRLHFVRDNRHAHHGVEAAIWDAFAKANDMRLVDLMQHYLPDGHQTREQATVGVSIGIQDSVDATLDIIRKRLDQGYQRIKLKIKSGWDVNLAQGVREALPDILLMLDANSAYTLDDVDLLKQLDAFDLLMIEQPLSHDDIYEHSKLQPQMTTPICLDESVRTVNDLRLALQVGAIKILNLKPARVGGFTECIKIYEVCATQDVPMWIGGMLETGIGRAMNVALASFPAVTLPCDISATERYFALDEDLTDPPFFLEADSQLSVPDGYGIGVRVQRDRLEKARALWDERDLYPLG